ncbi:hypothetical protein [Euzebya tangerina]|uniref:hypothetical protein n=1 Tax=Euzebya tangerina TaxID=591198 RepID=UPI000E319429|nr:hypothetical protein [Euzebya tangerina]
MQHVVRFTTAEGRDGTHFSDSLDDAVTFIERVRNLENASDVRLFKLTEVPVSFKTYYQAQVGGASVPRVGHATISSADDDAAADGSTTASALDSPAQDATPQDQTTPDQTGASSAALSAVEAGSPPLESRFSESNGSQESAPTNGRRLFSRA